MGGALAADVHGKNHHVDGSIANHVESFTLHTPKGVVEVTPSSDPELFWGTAGALGLTGVITDVTVRLLAVETGIREGSHTERFPDLDATMAQMAEGADDDDRYSVAWIDCLAAGRRSDVPSLTRGDQRRRSTISPRSSAPTREASLRSSLVSAPPWVPNGLLNRASIRRVQRAVVPRRPRCTVTSRRSRRSSTRSTGSATGTGSTEVAGSCSTSTSCPTRATAAVRAHRDAERRAVPPSFLAVLKRFGPGNPGPLSFPTPGWTLALDIPCAVPGLAGLLDDLDELVADAGGRVYLAKDSRLRPELLPVMYPELERFAELRARVDPAGVLQSDLQRRLGLP